MVRDGTCQVLAYDMSSTTYYFADAAVEALLPPWQDQLRLVSEALAALSVPGSADLPPKMPVDVGREGAFAQAMPAALQQNERRLVGMKWISGDPHRPAPTLGGLILLEDYEVGGVRGIMSASAITAARTAAVSMLAISLAPPRTEHAAVDKAWQVTFVGGGTQAFSHRAALLSLFPDARVRFVTRRPANQLPLEEGDEVMTPDALREAVKDADVVISSVAFGTPNREIDASWLEPGGLLVATDHATTVTAATVAGLRSLRAENSAGSGDLPLLITDDRNQFDAMRTSGNLRGYEPADATIGELLCDATGLGQTLRKRQVGQNVVVNHLGVAVVDLTYAAEVLDRGESEAPNSPSIVLHR